MPDIYDDIRTELASARNKYPRHPTIEHAYCVLDEERREVRRWVERKPAERDLCAMRMELVQLAAMAARMIEDVIDPALRLQRLTDAAYREEAGCMTCRHDGISKAFCASCEDGMHRFDVTDSDVEHVRW